MNVKWPPTPDPILPVQGYTWRLRVDSIVAAAPSADGQRHLQVEWSLDSDILYSLLQRWLQLARFWFFVIGKPMVHDCDYEAVREAALEMHKELPDECELPIYWYHNHLPCRYDHWCRQLFDSIPMEARKPRYPWVYGEKGIYNVPLDFSRQAGIITSSQGRSLSSGKLALGKMSYQFDD